jgi:tetratricopeptide (TPR) repeat protein
MHRWVAMAGVLVLAGPLSAQTGYQAERLAPDPVLKTPQTPESMLMRAGYEQRHQNCVDAGLHIDAVLADDPDWPGALAMRLFCERKENRRVDELADLNDLIEMRPKNWRWWSDRAGVHERDANREPAIEDLTEAIRLWPWDPDLYLRRSKIYAELRDYSKSFEDLVQVQELLPEQASPLLSLAAQTVSYGGTEVEASQYRKLAEIAAPSSPRNDDNLYTDGMSGQELMLRAGYAMSLRKWNLELRFLNAVIAANQSGLQRALEMRCMLGMMQPHLTTTAKYHPRTSGPSARNSQLDRDLNKPADPLQDINALILLAPRRPDYYKTRILLNRPGMLGNSEAQMTQKQVKQDLDTVITLEPYEAANYAERARFEAEHNNAAAAVNDYLSALDLDPGMAEYSFQLSRAYAAQRIVSAEIGSLNLALIGDPENSGWLKERAKLLP